MIRTTVSDNVAKQFSRAASHYDKLATIQQQIAAVTMAQIPVLSGRLLDIGCGTGRNTALLSEKGFKAAGVDLARGMVDHATARYPELNFVVGDAQSLPFGEQCVDTVFSSMALQWCNDTRRVMSEISRILCKNGVATLSIMTSGSFAQLDASRRHCGLMQTTNPMASHVQWCQAAKKEKFTVLLADDAEYTDTFTDILSLLRSIKAIGAGARCADDITVPLSRRQLQQLEQAYQVYLTPSGELPLTYRVTHLVLEK